MKDLLKKIWQKIKEHKAPIFCYIGCVLLVCFDLIFNFDLAKCITYIVMLFIVLIMIVYYIKIMSIANDYVLKKIENNIDDKFKNTSDRIKDLIIDFQAYVVKNPNSYIKDFEIRYNSNNDIFIFYENKLMSITNFCNMFIDCKNMEISKYSKSILQLLAEKK